MKKLLFSLLLSMSVVTAFGQYTLLNEETGNTINDGDIITIDTNNFTTHVIVTNGYTFPIKATMEVVSITNTDGSEMNMCFGFNGEGNCYTSITQGDVFESNQHGNSYLNPGASSGHYDIDFTHIDGNNGASFPNYPKDYVFKINIINANDDSVAGSTTFTYRYDPPQDVNTLNVDDVIISTGYHVLNIVSKHQADVTIYSLTGQKVKEVRLRPDQNHVYTGNMTPGIYLVHVTADGKEIYKKVVLK